MEARVPAAAPLYRRALYVITTLDIFICATMFIWVSQGVVPPWILIAMVPLGLTLWHMRRFAARDARKAPAREEETRQALAREEETQDEDWRKAA
jgi:hypothetical protein